MSNIDAVAPGGALGDRLKKHEHLIKYLLIGGSASALDVIIFMVLYNVVGTTELLAHSVSVPTAVLYSFVINARHNFKTNDHWHLRMALFILACTIGYAVGYLIIEGAVMVGLGANIGKIISLPFVFVTQYVLNSRITFREIPAR